MRPPLVRRAGVSPGGPGSGGGIGPLPASAPPVPPPARLDRPRSRPRAVPPGPGTPPRHTGPGAPPSTPLPGPRPSSSRSQIREDVLRGLGVRDCFAEVKADENRKALELLPGVLRDVDAAPPGEARFGELLRGVFAGNVFDLGASATAGQFESSRDSGAMFQQARAGLAPRPWAVDDADDAVAALSSGRHRKALLFVDNAGADVVLGVVPLARELLRNGTEVVLMCNSLPAVNDVTAPEMDLLLPALAAADAVLGAAVAGGRLRVVADGSGLPVIDLRRVSAACAAECDGADLVLLEGMGRGIETNLRARFRCDALCLGMIKHREVAASLGGRLYDCVCRYQPAPAGGAAL